MLARFLESHTVYLVCGYTDMRKSIDGLTSIVQQQFRRTPFVRGIFLFCGRLRERVKVLYWEGDGFVLVYKRLEDGRFQWPRNENEVRKLSSQQKRWLLEGLALEQPKAVKKVYVDTCV